MESLITNQDVTVSVSSTSDPKLFGKKYLIDGKEDTCWSSDQGQSQWLKVKFGSGGVTIKQLKLMFQGGFSSKIVRITFWKQDQQLSECVDIHPQDINSVQSFPINNIDCDVIKLDFIDFNDFYGRIVIYTLDIIGINKSRSD